MKSVVFVIFIALMLAVAGQVSAQTYGVRLQDEELRLRTAADLGLSSDYAFAHDDEEEAKLQRALTAMVAARNGGGHVTVLPGLISLKDILQAEFAARQQPNECLQQGRYLRDGDCLRDGQELTLDTNILSLLSSSTATAPRVSRLPDELEFIVEMTGYIKNFVERFESANDRGFVSMRNFRAQFTQALWQGAEGRMRLDLVLDAYRYYRMIGENFNVLAGGAGLRMQYDLNPARGSMLQITAEPLYGERRQLRLAGVNLGSDFVMRHSFSALANVGITDRAAAGVVISFQPQWVDFHKFRSMQEIYVKLRILRGRRGTREFYVENITFIPRIVHWRVTDLPTYNGGARLSDRAIDPEIGLLNQLRQAIPQMFSSPEHEITIMGSLAFRFSL